MMTQAAGQTPHLNDADLLRYIDEEGSALERARLRRHVESCEQCAREVALLHDQAQYVSGWLERVAFDAVAAGASPRERRPAAGTARQRTGARLSAPQHAWPPRPAGDHAHGAGHARRAGRARWAPAPWLRAAAAIVLIAAPVAALPSLRDWVGERLGGRVGEAPAVTSATAAAAADGPAASSLRFVPVSGVFTVDFDAAPAGGTLALGRAAGAEALLEVLGGETGTGPVVSDARLRISAGAGATASYVLRLPAGVSAVTVRVERRPLRTIDGAALDAGVVVPLADPARP